MKIMKWFLIALLIIVVVSVIASYFYLRATLPEYDGELMVQGISVPVEVIRDSCGVPHIFAQNEKDAYFALGYCMAQDRLVQLEIMRLMARGRLSEMMGEATVEVDKLHRIILSAYDLEKSFESSSPPARAVADSFIRGINAYIKNPQSPTPLEFLVLGHRPEPFTINDAALIKPLFVWMMSSSFRTELLKAAVIQKVGPEMTNELFVDHNEGYPTTIPEEESPYPGFKDAPVSAAREVDGINVMGDEGNAVSLLSALESIQSTLDSLGLLQTGVACNSLVISGEMTASGKPILAQDYHLSHVIPTFLYEAHLSTPTFKVAGYIFSGQPYVFGGQNEHVSWVFTNGGGDEIDFYMEKLHPDDPNKYLYKGAYEEMDVRKEIIKVKDGEDVEMTIRLTRHGPVIDELTKDFLKPNSPDTVYSMRMAGADSFGENEALYRMNTAKSADDFLAGVNFYKSPGQHWIYADDQGEIGYIYGAAIPVRNGFDGTVPVPGWTGEYEWEGYVPTEKLPQVRNPRMGFINTSNAKPASGNYPYHLGHNYSSEDRLTRVREIISDTIAGNGKFSADDVDKVFKDSYLIMAREWVPHMLSALKGESLNPNEQEALDKLSKWDYVSDKDSAAALIFQASLLRMIENTFSKHLGEDLYKELLKTGNVIKGLRCVMTKEESSWFNDPKTPEIEGRSELLVRGFREAVAQLEKDMGRDVNTWALGDCLTLTLRHPLSKNLPFIAPLVNVGPLRMSGGLIAPFAIYYDLAKPFEVVAGTQARFVVDFSNRENCRIVNMPGISGNFMSPHYDDQVQMWYDFDSRPLMLYRDEVEKDARYTMEMLPD